jgi:hypothetical protein
VLPADLQQIGLYAVDFRGQDDVLASLTDRAKEIAHDLF